MDWFLKGDFYLRLADARIPLAVPSHKTVH